MKPILTLLAALAVICLTSLQGLAQEGAQEGDTNETTSAAPVPEPMFFESAHMIKIDGRALEYTATAATMVMKNDKSKRFVILSNQRLAK